MGKIYICDSDHNDFIPEMTVSKREGIDIEIVNCKTQQEVVEKCKDAVVLINQYLKMDKVIFSGIPTLKCVVRYGVGFDNCNLKDANDYGVTICNIPDYGTCEVADQAFALMLTLVRKTEFNDQKIRNGIWDYRLAIPIKRLRETTIGVVGTGRIGTEFCKRALAFGCKVIAYDIDYPNANRKFVDGVDYTDFDTLLSKSDVISIHCVKDERSYHMFSDEQFDKMKKNAYIINVSRGGIIDEKALINAIKNGKISGAGIDVLEKEGVAENQDLIQLENVVLSPHIAWYSEESSFDLKRKVAEQAIKFVKTGKVDYKVN